MGVVERVLYRSSECARVVRGRQHARTGSNHLRDAAHPARDDRKPTHLRLEHDARKRFGLTRLHEEVGPTHQPGYLCPGKETMKRAAIAEPETFHELNVGRSLGAVSHYVEVHLATA